MPLSNRISLESHPDMSCNTYALYQYMLSKGLNKKYKLYWFVNDAAKFTHIHEKNVFFINYSPTNMWELIRIKYIRTTSRALVFSNRFMRRENAKQFLLYLQHGSPIKKLGEYFIGDRCDYTLYQSEEMKEIMAQEHRISKDKLICLGFPRNDLLFVKNEQIKHLIPQREDKKLIVWLPTYRQHKNTKEDSTKYDCGTTTTGFPFFSEKADFVKINKMLAKNKCILVVKPHPVQQIEGAWKNELSNVLFIDDNDLRENKLQLYELLAWSDALITDYSSVYFDYLLLDKPIALTFDDLKEYENNRGFVFDDIKSVIKGEYLYNVRDMDLFVEQVAQGEDRTRKEREEIKIYSNKFQDNQSSERVYQFLIENMGG